MKPTILQGDVRETLRSLPDNSVHCCVTCPPYWALRSYLPKDHPLKPLEIGSEPTPEAFVETMVGVFREVRRVLHPSGTCWVNIGDSYASTPPGCASEGVSRTSTLHGVISDAYRETLKASVGQKRNTICGGLKPKDLCLIPERIALALQSDGWWVRSRICWAKRSPMPESVTDRPTSAWEHIWLLTKSARYFYDAEAVKEQCPGNKNTHMKSGRNFEGDPREKRRADLIAHGEPPTTRNLRNFWLLGPEPYSEAHFATYPSEIPKRAILAGTSARGCCPKCLAPWERVVEREFKRQGDVSASKGIKGSGTQKPMDQSNGWEGFPRGTTETRTTGWRPTCECDAGDPIPCTVCDPFGGSGTTAAVALELGRKAILCELNPEYLKLIEQRTLVTAGLPLA